ncbi:hypothetical protein H9L39_16973 [Fusarium oxysporum f. sp. albedinis]|nr:hypothetical protein H9L39_16973 [Fusarium oxysporum f. sp. albedinis]
MKNGNVAFGDTTGSIIVFGSSTSEYISSSTIEQIALPRWLTTCCNSPATLYYHFQKTMTHRQPRMMRDRDLRVWSVAKKHSADDPAKVVRNLWKAETSMDGPNWMGWSKNGCIIQSSDLQTLSWDVRTKLVTYDPIPILDLVRGLAVHGRGATLFTLGPNNTV